MRSGFIDKLIERIRRVQPEEVQNYLVRLAQEKGFLERIFDALQEGVIWMGAEALSAKFDSPWPLVRVVPS